MLWVYTWTKDKFDGPKFGGLVHGGGEDYIREEKYFNLQSVELTLSRFHMIEGKFLQRKYFCKNELTE